MQYLSRSRPRFHRWQADVDRGQGPRRPAQRPDHSERFLQQDAVLGRPGKYARAAGGTADRQWVSPAWMLRWPGSQRSRNTTRSFRRSPVTHPMAPTWCGPSCPTNGRRFLSIRRSITSLRGIGNAIDDSAKRGWELFNTQGRCNKCHALTEEKRDVATFTDNDVHTRHRHHPAQCRRTGASGRTTDQLG